MAGLRRAGWLSGFGQGYRSLIRDWRSGELRMIVMALIVAVAAISSVGFLTDRVSQALGRNTTQMLGADVALEADTPISAEIKSQAGDDGLRVAETVTFPSMVSTQAGLKLASIKAVSPEYPLVPGLTLRSSANGSSETVSAAPAPGQAWVDPQILSLLNVAIGDEIGLGELQLTIAGVITYEPDRGVQFVNVAPRVMMSTLDLEASGLLGLGSRARYGLLAAGPSSGVDAYQAWLKPRLERGQRLKSIDEARPEIRSSLQRAQQFLLLVALLAVMIAAVAVALATRRFKLRHQNGFAVMRCLGAGANQLRGLLFSEFVLLAVFASLVGVGVGYGVHLLLVMTIASVFNTVLPAASWGPAFQGAIAGLILLLGFALAPLFELGRVSPARVLRDQVPRFSAYRGVAYISGLVAFVGLTYWVSGDARLTLTVVGGFLVALVLFAALSWLGLWLLERLRHYAGAPSVLRFALAGLARRRSLTVAQVSALSLGLMVLLLLTITRTDLLQGWQDTVPPDAPNTFLINIQPDQANEVQSMLRDRGLVNLALAPMIRGRLVAINGTAIDPDQFDSGRARRLSEREFNLSYRDTLPASNRVVSGQWIDPAQAEVSLEDEVAQTLGLQVGDQLQFDIAGELVDVRVSSLREVKWDSFDVNFFALMSESVLADKPASYLTSFYLPPSQAGLMQELVQAFPNITVFDVGVMLAQVQRILDQVIRAVQILFVFTLLAGVLVLAAAFFATREERLHEVAVLRMLGAGARQLRRSMRIELLLLGGLSGLLAAAGAVTVAALLAHYVLSIDFVFSWWPWALGIGLGVFATLLAGLLALRGVLNTPPLSSLRVLA
ncbi:MAG TPA: ABC transporter permease [Pusillimonas sp.]|nr:ABC transporter permease [Pusillimonas sp.]